MGYFFIKKNGKWQYHTRLYFQHQVDHLSNVMVPDACESTAWFKELEPLEKDFWKKNGGCAQDEQIRRKVEELNGQQ